MSMMVGASVEENAAKIFDDAPIVESVVPVCDDADETDIVSVIDGAIVIGKVGAFDSMGSLSSAFKTSGTQ